VAICANKQERSYFKHTDLNTSVSKSGNPPHHSKSLRDLTISDMSYFLFPCTSSDYQRTVKIGSGSFSQVWKARVPSRDAVVAIKIMDLENISSTFEDILKEVQTMRLAEDPNILHCFCSFVHHDQLWLITELMDKGSCVRVMRIANSLGLGEGMSEECLSYILYEVVKGLTYLHNQGQIHRDIKSGNILLNSAGEVKLADFGVSGWTVSRGQRVNAVKTFVGTPCYMAPEVMEQAGGYDFKADVWSVGITALELAKGHAPYAHLPPMKVLIKTIEEDPPSLQSYPHSRQLKPDGPAYSDLFSDFCGKCLQKAPKSRQKADDLLKHKLFKQCNKSALMTQFLCYVEPVGADYVEGDELNLLEECADVGVSSASERANAKLTPPEGESDSKYREVVQYNVFTDSDRSSQPRTAMQTTLSSAGQHEPPPAASTSTTYVPGTSWVFEEDELAPACASLLPAIIESDGAERSRKDSQKESLGDFLEDFEATI